MVMTKQQAGITQKNGDCPNSNIEWIGMVGSAWYDDGWPSKKKNLCFNALCH